MKVVGTFHSDALHTKCLEDLVTSSKGLHPVLYTMLKEQIQALYFMMQISFMVIVFSSFKMIILNQRVFRAGK
jgi:hypothetical protein